jgi:predicted MFS family arabinose efflux permease
MGSSSDLERAVDADTAGASIPKADVVVVAVGETDTNPPQPSDSTSGWTDKQSNVLPHKKLIVVFPLIALVQFTSYLDQTTISTAVPTIGAELQLGINVSWVATSFLLASTCTQLINGRLSDIFGRKELLLSSLSLLAIGNLCAGFSPNGAMLYVFRALSGLGGGAMFVSCSLWIVHEKPTDSRPKAILSL